jgi:hypothetical protein
LGAAADSCALDAAALNDRERASGESDGVLLGNDVNADSTGRAAATDEAAVLRRGRRRAIRAVYLLRDCSPGLLKKTSGQNPTARLKLEAAK